MTIHSKDRRKSTPVLDQYFIHAIEHARMRLVKEPRCQECTIAIEALDRLIEAAGGVSQA